jgi:hypothetical protein
MCGSIFTYSLSKSPEDNTPVTTDTEKWVGTTIPRTNVVAEDFQQYRQCVIYDIDVLLKPASFFNNSQSDVKFLITLFLHFLRR